MAKELSPGKPTTRRYSPEEKARAVRLVRQLRKELAHESRDDPARRWPDRLWGRVAADVGEAGRHR